MLAPDADYESLARAAERHAAHLSRNSLRQRADDRFVTQRCGAVGRVEAGRRLAALKSAVAPFAEQVMEVEEEYVIYDSNAGVDAGWILGEA